MERTLKIYIYKDGKKPIFHLPILKGLYASEGWFMKLMQGNKHFVVKDPRKAHLFYMPFSSRMLEYTLYVRNSHNRTNLRLYMKRYAESIAAKYSFWNRTGGADHFLVACHDWVCLSCVPRCHGFLWMLCSFSFIVSSFFKKELILNAYETCYSVRMLLGILELDVSLMILTNKFTFTDPPPMRPFAYTSCYWGCLGNLNVIWGIFANLITWSFVHSNDSHLFLDWTWIKFTLQGSL
jgi:hypothetical protein